MPILMPADEAALALVSGVGLAEQLHVPDLHPVGAGQARRQRPEGAAVFREQRADAARGPLRVLELDDLVRVERVVVPAGGVGLRLRPDQRRRVLAAAHQQVHPLHRRLQRRLREERLLADVEPVGVEARGDVVGRRGVALPRDAAEAGCGGFGLLLRRVRAVGTVARVAARRARLLRRHLSPAGEPRSRALRRSPGPPRVYEYMYEYPSLWENLGRPSSYL